GQVRNFERIAEKLFGVVGFASLADTVDGEETEWRGTGDELRKGALRLAVVSDRPIELWSDSGPVRACWSVTGVVVLGTAFVERKALYDEGGDFGGSLVVEVNKPSESV